MVLVGPPTFDQLIFKASFETKGLICGKWDEVGSTKPEVLLEENRQGEGGGIDVDVSLKEKQRIGISIHITHVIEHNYHFSWI